METPLPLLITGAGAGNGIIEVERGKTHGAGFNFRHLSFPLRLKLARPMLCALVPNITGTHPTNTKYMVHQFVSFSMLTPHAFPQSTFNISGGYWNSLQF